MHHTKCLLFGLLLIVACIAGAYGQNTTKELEISPDDYQLMPDGKGGFHLFIRKKPKMGSVLITSRDIGGIRDRVDRYIYRAWDWNPENGDEVYTRDNEITKMLAPWVLIDSTPEPHRTFGEAFHIYIPPIIYLFDAHETSPWSAVEITGTVMVNIRAFFRPNANPGSRFLDNEFSINTDRFLPDPYMAAQRSPDPEVYYAPPPPEAEPSSPPPPTVERAAVAAGDYPSYPAPEEEGPGYSGEPYRDSGYGYADDFSAGRRVGAVFMNPLLGLGSYTMGDWLGGMIITEGYILAGALAAWEILGVEYDSALMNIPGTIGLGVAGATFLFSILRPVFYHRPGSANRMAAVLKGAHIAVIPDAGGIKAVRLGYTMSF
ncbi:hypothetical protein AGMMS50267_13500 [Spirochaetia bacterium]|nr:hypothetical protein AGMMS50267_13500 [Spirochaetia bacterium]